MEECNELIKLYTLVSLLGIVLIIMFFVFAHSDGYLKALKFIGLVVGAIVGVIVLLAGIAAFYKWLLC